MSRICSLVAGSAPQNLATQILLGTIAHTLLESMRVQSKYRLRQKRDESVEVQLSGSAVHNACQWEEEQNREKELFCDCFTMKSKLVTKLT